MINGTVTAVALGRDECLQLLGTHTLGRLCVVENGYPVTFPVNFRMVIEVPDTPVIVVRVRAASVLDRPGAAVGFQVDGIDDVHDTGWSVLARGTLHDGEADGSPPWLRFWNPRPWVGPRDRWLYIPVDDVSGRQLVVAVTEWAFRVTGYL
jgi:uncharacterized protein